MIARYGTAHALKSDELKSKMIVTTESRYGAAWYNESNEAKSRNMRKYGSENYVQTEEFREKRLRSLRNNKTFNSSKAEDVFYERLIRIFPDAIRQYSDERYPYACDFYIAGLDLFLELNLSWTHGGHKFDESSGEDAAKLATWESLAKSSRYYANAIETWTRRDPEKLEKARRNNLNYVTLYSKNDCECFLKLYIKNVS